MKTIYLFLFVFLGMFYSQAQMKIGDSMPDFQAESVKGKLVISSNLKGKYVLIDFWASWCMPCRLGNKKLVKLDKEINHEKLEIIGISIDKDKAKWLKAIEKDKIKFTQLIDPDGFDAKTAQLFGVEELPSKFLFDDKGILVAINPTEEQLIKFIK